MYISVSSENKENYASNFYSIDEEQLDSLIEFCSKRLEGSLIKRSEFDDYGMISYLTKQYELSTVITFRMGHRQEFGITQIRYSPEYEYKTFQQESFAEIEGLVSFLLEGINDEHEFVKLDQKVFCKIIAGGKMINYTSTTTVHYFQSTFAEFLDLEDYFAEFLSANMDMGDLNKKTYRTMLVLSIKFNLSKLKRCNYDVLTFEASLDPEQNQDYALGFDRFEFEKSVLF
jgi:hypothetical protein